MLVFEQLSNVTSKLTPVQDGWQVFITWDKTEVIPNKYIVYITEPTESRFAVIEGTSISFSETVKRRGYYLYRVKAVYDDKEVYSRIIKIEIGCSGNCAQGGYSGEIPTPPEPEDYLWFSMTPNRA